VRRHPASPSTHAGRWGIPRARRLGSCRRLGSARFISTQTRKKRLGHAAAAADDDEDDDDNGGVSPSIFHLPFLLLRFLLLLLFLLSFDRSIDRRERLRAVRIRNLSETKWGAARVGSFVLLGATTARSTDLSPLSDAYNAVTTTGTNKPPTLRGGAYFGLGGDGRERVPPSLLFGSGGKQNSTILPGRKVTAVEEGAASGANTRRRLILGSS
jgi:hypothetical protein